MAMGVNSGTVLILRHGRYGQQVETITMDKLHWNRVQWIASSASPDMREISLSSRLVSWLTLRGAMALILLEAAQQSGRARFLSVLAQN